MAKLRWRAMQWHSDDGAGGRFTIQDYFESWRLVDWAQPQKKRESFHPTRAAAIREAEQRSAKRAKGAK